MREDLRHYVDTSMNTDKATYFLLGDGINSLTEEMNPEEETKHYINMAKAANRVKAYQRTFEVDREDCVEDDVQKWIDGLVDKLPTGAKAHTSFIRLRIKDALSGEGNAGKYKAIKVPCTVSVASSGGEGGDYVHNVINFKQCGDDIEGTFDVATSTFTANAATA